MASAPTHAVATAAIAAFFHRPRVPWHLWLFGALLAVAPDLDVFAPRVPVAYRDLVAHRGLSHSLLMAAVVSALVVLLFYRDPWPLKAKRAWLFLFLAMASHGLLDALTSGGPGVAFFAPFSPKRHFLPYRPLLASPLSIHALLTSRGFAVLLNEMRWVWAPSVGLALVVLTFRAWRRPPPRRVPLKPRPASQPRPAPPVPAAPRMPPPPPPPPAPLPAAEPSAGQTPARAAVARVRAALAGVAGFFRRRRRPILIGAAVVVVAGAGVFVALQPVPPPTAAEAPPPVAPPPRPLQVDAEGSYEPGYQFSVMGARFTRLTLLPEPFVTFARIGTRQEAGCQNRLVRADTVHLVCDVDRVGVMTIEGRFVSRFATTALDRPVLSALLTVRNSLGEIVYRARDSFVWRAPD